ncbi:hypothetical protein [Bathymodiolus platifrons methanotrophic gill symbiont]|uniref:hypothetical protein n=1 Tax=Bathymodiolus platifrons methanotrophic gill symbiont TaxID=113268 RepID=UPI0011CC418F|nr:hypothetical protein [Bathymodiolus platifrons methanotrophic gill symbiont]
MGNFSLKITVGIEYNWGQSKVKCDTLTPKNPKTYFRRKLMARLPRITSASLQRGNNRQACYGSEEGQSAYAEWLKTSWFN